MTFLNRFGLSAGRVLVTSDAPSEPAHLDALTFEAAPAECFVAFGGVRWAAQNGLMFDASGALVVVDASGGLPAGTNFQSGLPFSEGRLCVDADGALKEVLSGVPFTIVHAVAVSEGPPAPGPDALLQEDDDFLLQENGFKILLEA